MKFQNIISNFAYFFRIYKLNYIANLFYLISVKINQKNVNPQFKYADFLVAIKKFEKAKNVYLEISKNGGETEKSNALYYLAILSFNNKLKDNTNDLFNQSYEKKIGQKKNFLKNFYPPFILKFKVDLNNRFDSDELIKKFYDYEKKNSKTNYSGHGHINTYQSNHDLNKDQEFLGVTLLLEKNINEHIQTKIFINDNSVPSIKIKKMWFVISRTGSKMKKHMHHGFLSGVFYLKVSSNKKPGFIKFSNPKKNIKIFDLTKNSNYINKDEIITIKPSQNDMVIFNSYLEHWVVDNESESTRISIPWDAEF